MKVLLTGGCGFIGSHICVQLLAAGHRVLVVDNLSNSGPEVLRDVATITGSEPEFSPADLTDRESLHALLRENRPDAVIHLAGLKAVAASVADPLSYYRTNISGLINLCDGLAAIGVFDFIFSSSATVYGTPERLPLDEQARLQPVNPYGHSKRMAEQILLDLHRSNPRWKICMLRYFNPTGAHPSGLIGENPNDEPNNLMPRLCDAAAGKSGELVVFGSDYPTADGSGVRDYIHVEDLARGHLCALEVLGRQESPLCCNLGTGRGYSVLEMIASFERVNGIRVPFVKGARRPGDVAACYADPGLARQQLNWQAELGLEDMCRSAWHHRQQAAGHG